jgi:hypothetical protein
MFRLHRRFCSWQSLRLGGVRTTLHLGMCLVVYWTLCWSSSDPSNLYIWYLGFCYHGLSLALGRSCRPMSYWSQEEVTGTCFLVDHKELSNKLLLEVMSSLPLEVFKLRRDDLLFRVLESDFCVRWKIRARSSLSSPVYRRLNSRVIY